MPEHKLLIDTRDLKVWRLQAGEVTPAPVVVTIENDVTDDEVINYMRQAADYLEQGLEHG
jgi:hypothetical protein